VHELIQYEKLRAADCELLLGGAPRYTKTLHDTSQSVDNVGDFVVDLRTLGAQADGVSL
jgi:hypothetical protein